jgi:hypothetical protein
MQGIHDQSHGKRKKEKVKKSLKKRFQQDPCQRTQTILDVKNEIRDAPETNQVEQKQESIERGTRQIQ